MTHYPSPYFYFPLAQQILSQADIGSWPANLLEKEFVVHSIAGYRTIFRYPPPLFFTFISLKKLVSAGSWPLICSRSMSCTTRYEPKTHDNPKFSMEASKKKRQPKRLGHRFVLMAPVSASLVKYPPALCGRSRGLAQLPGHSWMLISLSWLSAISTVGLENTSVRRMLRVETILVPSCLTNRAVALPIV